MILSWSQTNSCCHDNNKICNRPSREREEEVGVKRWRRRSIGGWVRSHILRQGKLQPPWRHHTSSPGFFYLLNPESAQLERLALLQGFCLLTSDQQDQLVLCYGEATGRVSKGRSTASPTGHTLNHTLP